MRIGVMLRHYEQHEGGVKIYTQSLLPHLLSLGSRHEFVLIYQNPALIGTYASSPNVEEVAVRIPGTVPWDQLAVPWIESRKRFDVIFNPKFTVPLLAKAKTVFVLHGSEWFVIPETFLWYDRWYFKRSAPIYCRRATAFITVSHKVKEDAVEYTKVDPDKIFPVHNGYDRDRFRVIEEKRELEAVRERYRLPKRFILWVGQHYPPKNVGRLFQAFGRLKDQIDHSLVIAGEQRWRAGHEVELLTELGIEDRVHFSGWVSHDDLPAFYNLAELYAMPSLYEGFGIPLVEAMACGCPVLTSKTCTPPEVVGDAGYLVDPLKVDEIAEGMLEVLSNSRRRAEMSEKGVQRAKSFGWEKCARGTLAVIEKAGGAASSG